jgi:alpha-D-ribose 1-methylphosphonate 5-triphosphate diphosphatase
MSVVLSNANLVLADGVLPGTVEVAGDRIADVQPGGSAAAGAMDLEGDFLLPGVVDLHTDNLEREVEPRGGVRWPGRLAFLAHDAQCAAAGITTVLDALCVGDLGFDENRPQTCIDGVADLDALAPSGLLKCDHRLHLRCELPAVGMIETLARFAAHPALAMVSLMDHTPGAGQYADVARYRAMRARDGEAPAETDRRIAKLGAQRARMRDPNRRALLDLLRGTAVAVASHDDRTEAEVAANLSDGIAISEFPVSVEAAAAARRGGMGIVAGAPNLVRGGSHNGNVAVRDLLAAGFLDALASDYVPASLIHAAFLASRLEGMTLPRAVGLVSEAPARMIGFFDRGRIAAGQRADLVRVRVHEGVPVVRAVYCGGARVA